MVTPLIYYIPNLCLFIIKDICLHNFIIVYILFAYLLLKLIPFYIYNIFQQNIKQNIKSYHNIIMVTFCTRTILF